MMRIPMRNMRALLPSIPALFSIKHILIAAAGAVVVSVAWGEWRYSSGYSHGKVDGVREERAVCTAERDKAIAETERAWALRAEYLRSRIAEIETQYRGDIEAYNAIVESLKNDAQRERTQQATPVCWTPETKRRIMR